MKFENIIKKDFLTWTKKEKLFVFKNDFDMENRIDLEEIKINKR